jgi:anti-sigma28 factor (negative regulator of flagellin synthesis)
MTKVNVKKEEDKKEEEFECIDDECTFKVSKKFKSPEEKVEDLKQAIKDLGYEVEETEEGIEISK